ncbi:MAG: matrixin family metalloprotease [Acidimicrobiales bacterium]|nr:matrixin family metalloprotease [Acidimicrobiales bacterium]
MSPESAPAPRRGPWSASTLGPAAVVLAAVVLAAVVLAAAVLAVTAPRPAGASVPPPTPTSERAAGTEQSPYWRWSRMPVTWAIEAPYPGMSRRAQTAVFQQAFGWWAARSGVRFRRVAPCGAWLPFDDPRCGQPQIRVSFVAARHGRSWDPDLGAGQRAHGFPPCPDSWFTGCGDIHLDRSYPWSSSRLLLVAAHEIGHAIGISHAPARWCPAPGRGALMCPSGGAGASWDITEARARYGR